MDDIQVHANTARDFLSLGLQQVIRATTDSTQSADTDSQLLILRILTHNFLTSKKRHESSSCRVKQMYLYK